MESLVRPAGFYPATLRHMTGKTPSKSLDLYIFALLRIAGRGEKTSGRFNTFFLSGWFEVALEPSIAMKTIPAWRRPGALFTLTDVDLPPGSTSPAHRVTDATDGALGTSQNTLAVCTVEHHRQR